MRTSIGAVVVAALLLAAAGCSPEVCSKMKRCCQEAQEEEWVGRACGDIAMQTSDADSCRTILETVRFLYKDKEAELPDACRSK